MADTAQFDAIVVGSGITGGWAAKELTEAGLKALNSEIMLRLQEEGIAVLSDTTVHGTYGLRVAISNHRTRTEDIDLVIETIARIGAEVGIAMQATV